MRFKLAIFVSIIFCFTIQASAQTDTSASVSRNTFKRYYSSDSAALALYKQKQDSIKAVQDSLKAIADSVSMVWIKRPDPNRPNQFVDSLVQLHTVKNWDFKSWAKKFPLKPNRLKEGRIRSKGEQWFLGFVVFLLLFFAILKQTFSKELSLILESFYSNRVLGQINKEGNLFSSWSFLFLYILFGFTIGAFLYLCGKYFELTYFLGGFQWLLTVSLLVIGLFTFKIAILRLIGFIFDIRKLVKEYATVLFLSYFNAAILFLPLVVAFSLTPFRFAQIYIYIAIVTVVLIFFIQFLRAGTIILSNYRFPKVYLFLYICTLEICPLVILIKALRF
ncbi:DUF4271 domain-containing protein [Rubrolithibacter danxiaensis]|uniref:DUF4271 domain-containing protein n=1 Tax=Rubrolithibacter danxiaensis TaxID=3390805 RepID=UPI003BF844F6